MTMSEQERIARFAHRVHVKGHKGAWHAECLDCEFRSEPGSANAAAWAANEHKRETTSAAYNERGQPALAPGTEEWEANDFYEAAMQPGFPNKMRYAVNV